MSAWLESLSNVETIFFISSVVGSLLFTIWLVLQFVGGDGELDLDADVDIDLDVDVDVGDSDIGFKILSFQTISSFLMMFGLIGLAVTQELGGTEPIALLSGFASGSITAWAIAKLFQLFNKLQHSGTVDLNEAKDQVGTVYLTIPKGGTGKVTVTFNNRLMVLDATSGSSKDLETGRQVRITQVINDHKLVVEAV